MILRAIATGTGRATYASYGGTDTAYTLDGSTKKCGACLRIPQGLASTAIAKLGWRQGTVTGTAPSYAAALYAIDAATGNPTGAALATVSSHVPVGGNNNTNRTDTLADTYTVTPGTAYAVVMEYATGTVNGSNNCSFHTYGSTNSAQAPFGWTYDGTTWTKQKGPNYFFLVTSSSETIGLPKHGASTPSVRDATTYQIESGGLLTLPSSWGTYKIGGVWLTAPSATTASNTLQIRLYDTSNNLLQSGTLDTDITCSNASGTIYIPFDTTLATLSGGSSYRLVLYSSLTGASFQFNSSTFTDATHTPYPFGQGWYQTQRAHGSSSYVDTATAAPDWYIDIIPVASSGGGLGLL